MTFIESDLEAIIYNSPQAQIYKRGLYGFSYSKVLRQVTLGSYGRADLIGIRYVRHNHTKELTLDVYELKQDTIGVNTFLQCAGYVKGLRVFIKENMPQFNKFDLDIKINMVLIGKTLETKNNFCFLPDLIPNLRIFTYKYDFDGIRFKSESEYHEAGNTFSENTLKLPARISRELVKNMIDYRCYEEEKQELAF